MKTLYLVRHAKSSWAAESQPDIDRPLNERGYADAHLMSKHLHKEKCKPEVIITSPAIRAMSTALIFAGNLRYSKEDMLIRESLYESNKNEYLKNIHSIGNSFSSAMLFGHNPTMSELAEYLIPRTSLDMPTCCVICIEFEVVSWQEVTKSGGKLSFNISPALIKNTIN